MKRTLTLVIAGAALALAGCSGGDDDAAPAASASVSCEEQGPDDETVKELLERCDPDAVIDEPSPDEAEALVEDLAAIVPALADDPEDTVDLARNACSSIAGGANNVHDAIRVRFTVDGQEPSDNQVSEIRRLIEAQSWCG